MRPSRTRTLPVALTAALLAAAPFLAATPAVAGDIIWTTTGPQGFRQASDPPTADDYAKSDWTVVEESIDFVWYLIPGVTDRQRLAMDKVVEIYHDPSDAPRGLSQGARLIESGQYADAIAELEDVVGSKSSPSWAKARAAYLIGVAHAGSGNAGAAVAALETFLAQHSKSRYLPKASMELARAHVSTGSYDKARAAFAALLKMSGLSESDQIEAQYGEAWLDEQIASARGDKAGLEKALKGYDALLGRIKSRKDVNDLIGKCTVGKASCLVGLGRNDEAKTLCEKAVEQSTDEYTRAGAHTMLGRIMVLGAGAGAGREVLEPALLHFLRVVTLYGNAPGADEYLAESMYRAGQLFNEMRPATTTPTEEQKAEARKLRSYAVREWRECAQRFPSSSWGKKAAQQAN